MTRAVKRGLARIKKPLSARHMNVDEVAFKKGHRYITVISDREGRALALTDERGTESLASYLRTLTGSQLEAVKTFSMDMNAGYIRAARIHLERTARELNGESCISLEEAPPPKQKIVCSRSFRERITTYEAMRQAVCQYAERAAEKLRGERQFCRHIAVFVKTSPFAVNEPYYGNVASEKLMTPTQDTKDIIATAMKALDRSRVNGHRYAKAGYMLNDFTPTGVSQLNLFDDTQPRSNSNQLMKVLDDINHSGLGKCGLLEGV